MSPNSPTIRGLKGLATFLQKERTQLRKTPIVLVASAAEQSKPSRPAVDESVRQVQFMLQQRFNFRVAPVTIASSIPDTNSAAAIVDRVRAKTAVAVGSGNAMDAAKGLSNVQQIIYVPATYGASLVASAPRALHVNGQTGEIDVVAAPEETATPRTIHQVVLEEQFFDMEGRNVAIAAGMALACDHAGTKPPPSLPLSHEERYEFMASVGANMLSYGLEDAPRSKPLAVATALQATVLPNYSIFEIMASLLPAYDDSIVLDGIPDFLTTEPWENIVAALQENRATWGCWDAPDEEFRTLLSKKHLI